MAAAVVYACNLASPVVEQPCTEKLERLFNDGSEKVRQAAGDCFLFLDGDNIGRHVPLVRAYVESQAFPSPHDDLLRRLVDSRLPLPDIILRIADRFIAACGDRAGDIRKAELADGSQVAKLIVRLYVQASDGAVKRRCLDHIDAMERLGFYGMAEELNRVDR